ncbi:carbon-nitrogen hydrolase family protein [Nocardioides sp. L-11A]|uniref:carbon-nitrogen hydrolase family protein n=1 Tax=Nocardioides sp. L-11A TaxID=3043848 RepID=UPI00249B6E7B|nr:carbon-nitrogen hydrolase family protein [Nocardioides sp. L-11A]
MSSRPSPEPPRRRPVRVAAVQTEGGLDVERNVEGVRRQLVSLGADDGLDLVVLPEMFMFRALGERPIEEVAVPADSEVDRWLAAEARRIGAHLVAGLLRREADGRVRNETVVLDRSGACVGRYHKTHLFDAPGNEAESRHVQAGDHLLVVDADFGTFGLVVCYELRFPEISRELAAAGAELLVVPNSWPTGGAARADEDLTLLLAATALSAQAPVVHANQVGRAGSLDLCGQTGVLSPRGCPVAVAGPGVEIVVAELDLADVEATRRTRLVLEHRRPELYRPGAVRRTGANARSAWD